MHTFLILSVEYINSTQDHLGIIDWSGKQTVALAVQKKSLELSVLEHLEC